MGRLVYCWLQRRPSQLDRYGRRQPDAGDGVPGRDAGGWAGDNGHAAHRGGTLARDGEFCAAGNRAASAYRFIRPEHSLCVERHDQRAGERG
jgi:hypothetical protein